MTTNRNIKQLLLSLEKELTLLSLWSQEKPSEQALSSQQPFCCDTLAFEQWLQFIFIPRINAMITANMPLPTQIALCPMGEESFSALGKKAAQLINTLGHIDELLSGQRQQTKFLSQ